MTRTALFKTCLSSATFSALFAATPWEFWIFVLVPWVALEVVLFLRSPVAARAAARAITTAVTLMIASMQTNPALHRWNVVNLPLTPISVAEYNNLAMSRAVQGPVITGPADLDTSLLSFPEPRMTYHAFEILVEQQLDAEATFGGCGNGASLLFGADPDPYQLYVLANQRGSQHAPR